MLGSIWECADGKIVHVRYNIYDKLKYTDCKYEDTLRHSYVAGMVTTTISY